MSDWVLEWSRNQNAFHIQKTVAAVESNLNKLLSNEKIDYITIAVGDREYCERQAARFRYKLNEQNRTTKTLRHRA